MPDHGEDRQILDKAPVVGRRAMLQQSLLGAAMLAGAAVGGVSKEAEAQSAPAASAFRRIITGNNAQGKSYVVKDEMVKAGDRFKTDQQQPMGAGGPGDPPAMLPAIRPESDPPPGGTQTYFLTLAPTPKAPFEQIRAAAPKAWDRTGSVVNILVVDNEITMVHEIGETEMKAGDLMVLRNSMHSWYNHTDKPTNIFAVKTR